MNSPLAASNDIRNMNAVTKNILTNKEVIALNQDALAKQCERKINDDTWNVFIKQLINGDYALAILNRSEKAQRYTLKFSELGLLGKYEIRDLWNHKELGKMLQWNGLILSHETKLFRIKPTNKF